MEYEWDPEKNESNLSKHRIDFSDAISVFDDPHRFEVDATRPEHGEQRSKTIGGMGPVVIAVIFTIRGGRRRIISARRAPIDERRTYDQGTAQQ